VTARLEITADWERLDEGSPEERACFAAIAIRSGVVSLTDAQDSFVNRVRSAPFLSAYHLAEWLAWNWWRLRWEPRSNVPDWAFAHHMTTIGNGYVWPNITIFSDGQRIALIAKPTRKRVETAYRYVSDAAAVVGAREFENSIDGFVGQVRDQLRAETVEQTNLDRIWADVLAERNDPEIAKRRKLEALLGLDPDLADIGAIEGLIADAAALGQAAINEIAADQRRDGEILTGKVLRDTAEKLGYESSPKDVVSLGLGTVLPSVGDVPAWFLGSKAAKALRDQEKLGTGPLSNLLLSRLAGASPEAISTSQSGSTIPFALDKNLNEGRVVLRSKWESGRRFELARLLCDRLVRPTGGKLFPATRSHTYRQKMQRAFAAELLSPFEAVEERLAGDYSSETQEDVAEYFDVSPMTIRTLLVNHGRLEREELSEEFDTKVELASQV
jgi:hypothetical protein